MDKFDIIVLIISFVGIFIGVISKNKAKNKKVSSQMPTFSGEEAAPTRTYEYETEFDPDQEDDWLPRNDYFPIEEKEEQLAETSNVVPAFHVPITLEQSSEYKEKVKKTDLTNENVPVESNLWKRSSVADGILWSEILKPKF